MRGDSEHAFAPTGNTVCAEPGYDDAPARNNLVRRRWTGLCANKEHSCGPTVGTLACSNHEYFCERTLLAANGEHLCAPTLGTTMRQRGTLLCGDSGRADSGHCCAPTVKTFLRRR